VICRRALWKSGRRQRESGEEETTGTNCEEETDKKEGKRKRMKERKNLYKAFNNKHLLYFLK
jgi:hypothetical protein